MLRPQLLFVSSRTRCLNLVRDWGATARFTIPEEFSFPGFGHRTLFLVDLELESPHESIHGHLVRYQGGPGSKAEESKVRNWRRYLEFGPNEADTGAIRAQVVTFNGKYL